jgi:hypothetical protein
MTSNKPLRATGLALTFAALLLTACNRDNAPPPPGAGTTGSTPTAPTTPAMPPASAASQ